jgi:hypothetical protein
MKNKRYLSTSSYLASLGCLRLCRDVKLKITGSISATRKTTKRKKNFLVVFICSQFILTFEKYTLYKR